jgi:hypothetical protein
MMASMSSMGIDGRDMDFGKVGIKRTIYIYPMKVT